MRFIFVFILIVLGLKASDLPVSGATLHFDSKSLSLDEALLFCNGMVSNPEVVAVSSEENSSPKLVVENSVPFVRFDGDDFMTVTGTTLEKLIDGQKSQLQVFVVARANEYGQVGGRGSQELLAWEYRGLLAADEKGFGVYFDRSGFRTGLRNDSYYPSGMLEPRLNSPLHQWQFYSFRLDGSDMVAKINGQSKSEKEEVFSLQSKESITGERLFIGKSHGEKVHHFFKGDIAEIILFDKALSSEEELAINDYLANKYKSLSYEVETTNYIPFKANTDLLLNSSHINCYDFFSNFKNLNYVVNSIPQGVTLKKLGSALTVNDSFTQADLSTGKLTINVSSSFTGGEIKFSCEHKDYSLGVEAVKSLSSLSGLTAHYDANESSSLELSEEGNVLKWKNMVSDNHHATQPFSPINQPKISKLGNSNLSAIDFKGGQFLRLGYATWDQFINVANKQGTLVTVSRSRDNLKSPKSGYNGIGIVADEEGFWGLYQDKDNLVAAIQTEKASWNVSPVVVNKLNESYVSIIEQNGDSLCLSTSTGICEVTTPSPIAYDAGQGYVRFGSGRVLNGLYFDGQIAEVLFFNRVLSRAEKASVDSFLQSKYLHLNVSGDKTVTATDEQRTVLLSSKDLKATYNMNNTQDPSEFSYTLKSSLAKGTLQRNGLSLGSGDSFTQADLLDKKVTYTASHFDQETLLVELNHRGMKEDITLSFIVDSDFDGLSDDAERAQSTNPLSADSDNDGLSDKWEEENGTDYKKHDAHSYMANIEEWQAGLIASYYHGYFTILPEFSKLKPAKVEMEAHLNYPMSPRSVVIPFASSERLDYLAVKFQGYLFVPKSGKYKFYLNSDDGSRFVVNDQLVVSNNALRTENNYADAGEVELEAGLQPIYVDFFENEFYQHLTLSWESDAIEKEVIPEAFFFSKKEDFILAQTDLDSDQDGLSNARELELGTDPNKADSDNDGVSDFDEIEVYGTNAKNVDSDSDGVNDYDEALVFISNPKSADITGFTEILKVNGAQYSSILGRWIKSYGSLISGDRRGYVEYEIELEEAGVYRADLNIKQRVADTAYTQLPLVFFVNNDFVFRRLVETKNSNQATFATPYLQAGTHKLRFYLDNVYSNTGLRIDSLVISSIQGTDLNNNSTLDYLDYRISKQCRIDSKLSSKVSPFTLEGKGRYLNLMTSTQGKPARLTKNHFYNDVTLNEKDSKKLTISWQNGLHSRDLDLNWEETNLLQEDQQILIREGDSLLLNAYTQGATVGNATITIGDTVLSSSPTEAKAFKFSNAGEYSVLATFTDQDGTQSSKTVSIKVVSPVQATSPWIWTSQARRWDIQGLTNDMTVEGSGMELSRQAEGYYLIHRQETDEEVNVAVRLNNDLLLNSIATQAFMLKEAVHGYVHVDREYEDGSSTTVDTVFTYNFPKEAKLDVRVIASGVTFPDGSLQKNVPYSTFDSLGQWQMELYRGPGRLGATCHRIFIYQDGTLVGKGK